MYLTLYRKWRPADFEDILGQEEIVQVLKNSILLNRISHAYLFCGPRGTGKTSCARIFAKALNCETGPTPKPCQKCPNCDNISRGNSLDVLEIDAASNRGIENIRELRERVRLLPIQGKYKVYIIDEVHMLTGEAFNALLKTLEEPPSHAVFIMATTEAHKLPATIISRCQRFDFKRISPGIISAKLKKEANEENISIEDRALNRIAESADGSMRDAESILDQLLSYSNETLTEADVLSLLGRSNIQKMKKYIECILNASYGDFFIFLDQLISDGIDLMQFSKDLIVFARDLFVLVKTKGQAYPTLKIISMEDLQEYADFAFSVQESVLTGMILLWGESLQNMRYLSDPEIFFELTAIKMKQKYDRSNHQASPEIVSQPPMDTYKNSPEATSSPPVSSPVETKTAIATPDWEDFLKFLKSKEFFFYTTLSKGSPAFQDKNTLSILLPKESKFLVSHLEKKDKLDKLEALLKEFYGRPIRTCLTIGSTGASSDKEEDYQETEKKLVMEDPMLRETIELFSADIQYIEKKGR